jgi:RNA polymerase-associated protein CTR9
MGAKPRCRPFQGSRDEVGLEPCAQNPGKDSLGAALLIGLQHLNAGRDPKIDEEIRAVEYEEGIKRLQDVFKADKCSASAASGLAGHFLTMRQWPTAIKLGERAIQYADSRAALSEGNLVLARALHATNLLNEAAPHYIRAAEKSPEQLVAAVASAVYIIAKGAALFDDV